MTTAVLSRDPLSQGVFARSDELSQSNHELVSFCRDERTGLRAIISVHDTTLGPALGGTRFYPYRTEGEALTDALRLSQGMTYKAAAAGMPLGGGKAVIIGDPTAIKTPDLLRAYGRFIDTLGGTYITAADVGTTSDDLDVIGEVTRRVVGRNKASGGSGDSGYSTAFGVFCSMRSAAELAWGSAGLRGRTVGVEGAGKVGFHLVGLLLDEGASVVVSDPYPLALEKVTRAYGDVSTARSVIDAPVDVYAPCALGATLTKTSAMTLEARVVCGAANNQLLTSEVDGLLSARGVLWVPDFVANAGGLIQVGGELQAKTDDDVLADVRKIGATVTQILLASRERGVSTGVAALDVVQARLKSARPSGGQANLTKAQHCHEDRSARRGAPRTCPS